ncbi:sugar phosphate isomerase/epimerase, partial [Candidatus Sumerlaeota bacterium]|nr:sugar phosphate isomerase/epimerase [Candidatus Sumerlaeota bacterium]
ELQAFYHFNALSDPRLISETAEMVKGLPLIAMHGPFGDLNPGSFDPLVRETAAKRIQQGFNAASHLGAKRIIFHDGRVPGAGPVAPWIERSVEFWKGFMKNISEDIHVYLENMLEEGPELLKDMLDQAECPNLHANLDVGHAHCHSRTSAVKWIMTLRDRIGYVHLHDNHGKHDEHLGLGKGNIPLEDVCHALEEYAPHAFWALEAEENGIDESIDWLERKGFLTKNRE